MKLGKDEKLDTDPLSPNYGDQLIVDDDGVMEEGLAQAIRIKLLFVFGEWFLDASLGVPYFEIIWVKHPNMDHIRTVFRSAILSVPGIKDVTSLGLSLDARTRELTVNWVASADIGELEGSVVV